MKKESDNFIKNTAKILANKDFIESQKVIKENGNISNLLRSQKNIFYNLTCDLSNENIDIFNKIYTEEINILLNNFN